MLEHHDYFDENQEAAIMGIVRSAVVCLHSLLEIKKRGDCNQVLAELFVDVKCNERSLVTGNVEVLQERFIVENLDEILFADKFENFRGQLITQLNSNHYNEQAWLFQERLAIARSLPPQTKGILTHVVGLLKESQQKFLDWLFSKFFDAEHHTTQVAVADLMFNYLPNIYYPNTEPESNPSVYFNQNLPPANAGTLYRDLAIESNPDEIIKLIQMLKTGVLANNDRNYIWKMHPAVNVEALELAELKQVLEIAEYAEGEDLSEKISLLLDFSEHPVIVGFKQQKLQKIRLDQLKYKLC